VAAVSAAEKNLHSADGWKLSQLLRLLLVKIGRADWHEEELAARERKIESEEAKFVEWEKAKADIRRYTS
jgi:hypothetical protein